MKSLFAVALVLFGASSVMFSAGAYSFLEALITSM